MKENEESFKEVHTHILGQIQNIKEEPQFPDFNTMVMDLLKNESIYGIHPGKNMKIFGHTSMPKHK